MLVLTGIFAGIVTVCSWITVPLPFTQVPINLAVLGVLLAGGCLGSKYGSLSILIYILLGAVGIPVFAGFGAGLGTLAGPTGGYIVGYILCAAIAGLGSVAISKTFKKPSRAAAPSQASNSTQQAAEADAGLSKKKKAPRLATLRLAFLMVLGVAACYALGTLWYAHLMQTTIWAALALCVIPFIPCDALKIAAAVFLVTRLRHLLP